MNILHDVHIYILVLVLADYPPSWREQLWAQRHRMGGAAGTGGPAYTTPASHTGTWPDAAEENRSSQSGWLHPLTQSAMHNIQTSLTLHTLGYDSPPDIRKASLARLQNNTSAHISHTYEYGLANIRSHQ